MTKRILALLLALCLLLPLAACGGDTGGDTPDDPNVTAAPGEPGDPSKPTAAPFVEDPNAPQVDVLSAATPAPKEMKPVEDYVEPVPAKVETLVTKAETWLCNEMTFVSSTDYGKKTPDEATLDIILKNGDDTLTIPGFWDGELIWRVRFALPKTGTWTWETVCSDTANAGLHGKSGSIECTAYSGDLDIYKHGFVKTVPDTRYFVYDDGTPFFYLGDTHWNYLTEEYDKAGTHADGIETPSHFKYIVNKRVAQGYTVYQTEPLGVQWTVNDGISSTDVRIFKKADQYYQYIAAQGLVHANAEFCFPSDFALVITNKTFPNNLEVACRYWVARYGAYPVMWTLAQEIDQEAYFLDVMTKMPSLKNKYTEYPYITMANYMAKYDAYKHPLSGHMQGTKKVGDGTTATTSSFRDCAAHTWWATQWKPVLEGPLDFTAAWDFWKNGQGKPAIVYEGCYDHLWTDEFGARAQGWVGLLSGMYGYGYGGIDLWLYQSTYDIENDTVRNGIRVTKEDKAIHWGQSIEFPAGYQCGYMREFFEQYEWWKLIPRFGDTLYFTAEAAQGDEVKPAYAMSSTEDQSLAIVYLYHGLAFKCTKTGTLGKLDPAKTYVYQWYNPRTNAISNPKQAVVSDKGTYEIGARPDDNDWVFVIREWKG